MNFFGRRLSEYAAFSKLFLVLIPLAGIVRLALSLSGMPNDTVKWVSVTVLVWIAVIYNSVRVHTTGFGSYNQLLVIVALLNLSAQVVIIAGILLAIVTGTNNIFSAPEYAFGSGNQWLHLGAHLLIGTTMGTLVPWAIGSLILFVTKKLTRSQPKIRSVA